MHFAAFAIGGSLAIRTDRGTRRARSAGERLDQLARLARAHPIVMRSIWASVVSGAALFALATNRYVTSGTFWIKMAFFGALLANGLIMQVAERDARDASAGAGAGTGAGAEPDAGTSAFASAWSRIGASAVASTALWLSVAGAGVVLTIAGWSGSR